MAYRRARSLIAPAARIFKPIDVPNKLLTGPGPCNVPPRILAAGALPQLSHLHPDVWKIMDDITEGVKYVFQTENKWTFAMSGSGHAAMEAACLNLVEPNERVMIANCGMWGKRFTTMVQRAGGDAREIKKPLGEVFSLEDIEEGLKKHKPVLLFITQGESSSGALQPLEGVGELCHKYNCLLLVDSVASLGGTPMFMDEWGIDIMYSGSQKCLSTPPGTAPISLNERAREKVTRRKTPPISFYFDFKELANFWGFDDPPRRYHHTCPTSCFYALREGLAMVAAEGLEASWKRHEEVTAQFHKGLGELGLELFVKNKEHRLNTVTAIDLPKGLDWKVVQKYAMDTYKLEISAGLGPSSGVVGRFGFLGYNANLENVRRVLRALNEGLDVARKEAEKSKL